MPLTLDEVEHIAELAKLALSDEEQRRFAEQLSAVLAYAARLEELDTEHIPPTATAHSLCLPLRPDEPSPPLPREDLLANAPRIEEDRFHVPPVWGPESPEGTPS